MLVMVYGVIKFTAKVIILVYYIKKNMNGTKIPLLIVINSP